MMVVNAVRMETQSWKSSTTDMSRVLIVFLLIKKRNEGSK